MLRITNCPCCGAPIERTIPVVIAPFIRERLGITVPVTGTLSDCPVCGFRCFVDRYAPTEIASLYRDYRGELYFRQRNRHEPWYTRSFNQAIGGPQEVSRRTTRLDVFLRESGIRPVARSVLDWGGDRGQFIPKAFAERFVYDISGVEPESSVTAVSTDQLRTGSYDLLIAAHVLEHAADPAALLCELLEIPAAHLYVEVPYEPIKLGASQHSSHSYIRWVQKAARSRWYPLLAFVSTAARLKLGRLPPFGVLQQHEHLNYFDEATLVRLLERVGCRVVRTVSYRRNGNSGPVEALGALAIPPGR